MTEAQTRVSRLFAYGIKGTYTLMLWLGFTIMNISSCGCLLIVPIISAYDLSRGSMLAYASPSNRIAIVITGLVT